MFEEQEWKQLVTQLIKLTRAGTVEWKSHDNEAVASVGDFQYCIGSIDNDGRIPYFLSIEKASTAEEIDRLESEPVNEEPFAQPSAGEKLLELRHLAFRSSMGAPQIFGKLMAGLQDAEGAPF